MHFIFFVQNLRDLHGKVDVDDSGKHVRETYLARATALIKVRYFQKRKRYVGKSIFWILRNVNNLYIFLEDSEPECYQFFSVSNWTFSVICLLHFILYNLWCVLLIFLLQLMHFYAVFLLLNWGPSVSKQILWNWGRWGIVFGFLVSLWVFNLYEY